MNIFNNYDIACGIGKNCINSQLYIGLDSGFSKNIYFFIPINKSSFKKINSPRQLNYYSGSYFIGDVLNNFDMP
jgi:hypothetical protein